MYVIDRSHYKKWDFYAGIAESNLVKSGFICNKEKLRDYMIKYSLTDSRGIIHGIFTSFMGSGHLISSVDETEQMPQKIQSYYRRLIGYTLSAQYNSYKNERFDPFVESIMLDAQNKVISTLDTDWVPTLFIETKRKRTIKIVPLDFISIDSLLTT